MRTARRRRSRSGSARRPRAPRSSQREVSDLRSGVDALLAEGGADEAITWVEQRTGVDNDVAAMVVRYLAAGRTALGVVPTLEHIVLERFFDDSGGMQLVVHAPFGGRVNRALGLALRKRFCATFDFELQAAASDDCVLLSLGPQHSFPLEDIPKFLSSNTVEEVLHKAAIFAPMWAVRWRWNLNRSLTVLRFKGGRKNPGADPAARVRRHHGARSFRSSSRARTRTRPARSRRPTIRSSTRRCTTACTR